jgi:hypothetical protein
MPSNYKVKKNETLFTIAKDKGFISIISILDANKESWPYLSIHPNALIEGMTIIIPEKKSKKVKQDTGTEVSYVVSKPKKLFLNLKIEDFYGEIKSVKDDVQLIINGNPIPFEDKTNYDIVPVEFKIISSKNPLPEGIIRNSSLKLTLTSPLNGMVSKKEIKLEVGGLDPIIDPDGGRPNTETDHLATKMAIQKILSNLGYYDGKLDGDLNTPISILSISRFQNDFLQMTPADANFGKPTAQTCALLSFQQGISLGAANPIKI